MNFQKYNITSVTIPSGTVLLNNSMSSWFARTNIKTVNIATDVLDQVSSMGYCFEKCAKFIGPAICGKNVTGMQGTYQYCYNLSGPPVCGENVTSMLNAYYDCRNMLGSPVCGNKVTSMRNAYQNCHLLTGSPVCGPEVTDMNSAYYYCYNLSGPPVCGENVINMSFTYSGCNNLTGSPVCGEKVTDMRYTYSGCYNLTGSPVCGENVTTMFGTYHACYGLTGSPVCGENVTNMSDTYQDCNSLTGSPVCGSKVTDMDNAYYNCYNLTGLPVCGSNVTNMYRTYYNCRNLIGAPACGLNVTNFSHAYYNCGKLSGNMYIYSNNITNMRNCFYGKNDLNTLNIYVTAGSTSLNTLRKYTNNMSILGKSCSLYSDTANNRYYNSAYNLYIYPVDNVFQARIDNGDIGLKVIASPRTDYITGDEFDPTGMMLALCFNDSNPIIVSDYTYHIDENNKCIISCVHDGQEYSTELQLVYDTPLLSDFVYRDNGDQTYTITAWNGTLEGEASTKLIFPADVSIII